MIREKRFMREYANYKYNELLNNEFLKDLAAEFREKADNIIHQYSRGIITVDETMQLLLTLDSEIIRGSNK